MNIKFKPRENLKSMKAYLKGRFRKFVKPKNKNLKVEEDTDEVGPESVDQQIWLQKFADLKIDSPLQDALQFKAKLEIGEQAYSSLRFKTFVEDVWDSTGVGISSAGFVGFLGTKGFFGTAGILGLLGIGTAAAPLTVIIAAGVVSGLGWRLLRGYLRTFTAERILLIPKYLNTPLDILAIGIFDLLATLSLKVAKTDGIINGMEFDKIVEYFVSEWGYDQKFVEAGISYLLLNLDNYDTEKTAQEFGVYLRENPDCNFKSISRGTSDFLEDLVAVEKFGYENKMQEVKIIQDAFLSKNSYFEKFMSQIPPVKDLKGYLQIMKKVK